MGTTINPNLAVGVQLKINNSQYNFFMTLHVRAQNIFYSVLKGIIYWIIMWGHHNGVNNSSSYLLPANGGTAYYFVYPLKSIFYKIDKEKSYYINYLPTSE